MFENRIPRTMGSNFPANTIRQALDDLWLRYRELPFLQAQCPDQQDFRREFVFGAIKAASVWAEAWGFGRSAQVKFF